MHKTALIAALEIAHQKLFRWIEKQPDSSWEQGPENKWTTGQHVLHLVEASKKLNFAMSLPRFILKSKFGRANRPVRSYEKVVARYEEKLALYQDKAATYNAKMKTPTLKEKKQLLHQLALLQKKLQFKASNWKDRHLDTVILAHPLLGKMPIRELLMWTAHHTAHHTETLIENY